MIYATLVALALTTSGQSQATATSNADQAKPPQEKEICRSEQTAGSRVATHTCHTKAEWDEIDKRNAVDEHQMGRAGSSMSQH